MNVDRAERARIVEHDTRSITECEERSRESRQRIVDAIDLPIAGHTEMRVHDTTVVEHDELVLAPSLDGAYGRAGQRAKSWFRDPTPQ